MHLPHQKRTLLLLLLLCLGIVVFALLALDYETASAYPIFPFVLGGRIALITACSNGLLLAITPPRPGLFMFMTGVSTLHPFFALHPGALVLGDYVPGGACACPNGCCKCGAISAQGTIGHIGTGI